jgi:hypothetical protein
VFARGRSVYIWQSTGCMIYHEKASRSFVKDDLTKLGHLESVLRRLSRSTLTISLRRALSRHSHVSLHMSTYNARHPGTSVRLLQNVFGHCCRTASKKGLVFGRQDPKLDPVLRSRGATSFSALLPHVTHPQYVIDSDATGNSTECHAFHLPGPYL